MFRKRKSFVYMKKLQLVKMIDKNMKTSCSYIYSVLRKKISCPHGKIAIGHND